MKRSLKQAPFLMVLALSAVSAQANRLILRFPNVTCSTFALRITSAYGGSPATRELALYE